MSTQSLKALFLACIFTVMPPLNMKASENSYPVPVVSSLLKFKEHLRKEKNFWAKARKSLGMIACAYAGLKGWRKQEKIWNNILGIASGNASVTGTLSRISYVDKLVMESLASKYSTLLLFCLEKVTLDTSTALQKAEIGNTADAQKVWNTLLQPFLDTWAELPGECLPLLIFNFCAQYVLPLLEQASCGLINEYRAQSALIFTQAFATACRSYLDFSEKYEKSTQKFPAQIKDMFGSSLYPRFG